MAGRKKKEAAPAPGRLGNVVAHAERERRRMERAALAPQQKARTSALLADPDAIAEVLTHIADGGSLRRYCDDNVLSYGTLQRTFTTDERLAPLYDAALEARTDLHREKIEQLTRRVTNGDIDPKAAAVAISSLQWLAQAMNPRRYGQRQQLDVKVTDVTKLHLAAVQALANKPRAPAVLEAVETKPGEFSVPGGESEA